MASRKTLFKQERLTLDDWHVILHCHKWDDVIKPFLETLRASDIRSGQPLDRFMYNQIQRIHGNKDLQFMGTNQDHFNRMMKRKNLPYRMRSVKDLVRMIR